MPSFDVTSEMNWQELDNAVNLTLKEVQNRYDFRGVKCECDLDKKQSIVTLWCSSEEKFDALNDTFQNKVIKRGISLLSFDYQKKEPASGSSLRQKLVIQAGIPKDKAKKIIAEIKNAKLKVQAQIQDEQVRITGKKRDDLQQVITLLKEKQDILQVPMNYGNFRD